VYCIWYLYGLLRQTIDRESFPRNASLLLTKIHWLLWFVSQPVCSRLWCTNPHNEKAGCKTQHMPWADGTICSNPGAKETMVMLNLSLSVCRCLKTNFDVVVLRRPNVVDNEPLVENQLFH